MNNKFYPPQYRKRGFTCPVCGTYSDMLWYDLTYIDDGSVKSMPLSESSLCQCVHCGSFMLWVDKTMVVPNDSPAPMAHNDMPEDIKKVYMEARDIAGKSPKGACALLRLALQMLCDELVFGNKNINDKIGELVKNGLPKTLQQAFDLVRVVGNNAVHPGVINVDDDPNMTSALFELLNIIVEYMIAKPKEIDAFYNNTIPTNVKQAIVKRDT